MGWGRLEKVLQPRFVREVSSSVPHVSDMSSDSSLTAMRFETGTLDVQQITGLAVVTASTVPTQSFEDRIR